MPIKDDWDGMGSVYFELVFKKKILEKELQKRTESVDKVKQKIEEIKKGMEDILTGAFFTKDPLISDGVIDLRTPYLSMGTYYICLHQKKEVIGLLNYRGYHQSNLGDVGLYINEEYQHQGYGKKAMTLFSYFAYSGNVNDFRIYVYDDNLASINLVILLGGQLIGKEIRDGKTVLIFDVATMARPKDKEKKIGEIRNDNN